MEFSNVRAVLFDLDGTLYYQLPLRILMGLELAKCPLEAASRYFPRNRTVLNIPQDPPFGSILMHLLADLRDEREAVQI